MAPDGANVDSQKAHKETHPLGPIAPLGANQVRVALGEGMERSNEAPRSSPYCFPKEGESRH